MKCEVEISSDAAIIFSLWFNNGNNCYFCTDILNNLLP